MPNDSTSARAPELKHVCGLQGFGRGAGGLFDRCPACEAPATPPSDDAAQDRCPHCGDPAPKHPNGTQPCRNQHCIGFPYITAFNKDAWAARRAPLVDAGGPTATAGCGGMGSGGTGDRYNPPCSRCGGALYVMIQCPGPVVPTPPTPREIRTVAGEIPGVGAEPAFCHADYCDVIAHRAGEAIVEEGCNCGHAEMRAYAAALRLRAEAAERHARYWRKEYSTLADANRAAVQRAQHE